MIDLEMMKSAKAWLKTAIIAGIGGGIAGASAAAINPQIYHFPADFGSGTLWKFFFQGFFLTMGALLLKSPWGQKVMGSFKDAQSTLQQSQQELQQAKAEFKTPPPALKK